MTVAELPCAFRRRGVRRLATALVVPTALGGALLSGASARADVVPPSGSLTVTVADGQVNWPVPAGVTSVTITAAGGAGAKGMYGYASDGGPGGHGSLVTEDVPVVPGEVLSLSAGGAATSAAPGLPGGHLGRGGGGGAGDDFGGDGGGGGAASSVSSPSAVLAVAGGGGGGGGAGLDNTYIAGEGGSAGGFGSAATGANGGAGGSGHVTADPRDVGQTAVAAMLGSMAVAVAAGAAVWTAARRAADSPAPPEPCWTTEGVAAEVPAACRSPSTRPRPSTSPRRPATAG